MTLRMMTFVFEKNKQIQISVMFERICNSSIPYYASVTKTLVILLQALIRNISTTRVGKVGT